MSFPSSSSSPSSTYFFFFSILFFFFLFFFFFGLLIFIFRIYLLYTPSPCIPLPLLSPSPPFTPSLLFLLLLLSLPTSFLLCSSTPLSDLLPLFFPLPHPSPYYYLHLSYSSAFFLSPFSLSSSPLFSHIYFLLLLFLLPLSPSLLPLSVTLFLFTSISQIKTFFFLPILSNTCLS